MSKLTKITPIPSNCRYPKNSGFLDQSTELSTRYLIITAFVNLLFEK